MTVFYGDYPRRGLPGGSSRGSVSHGVGLKGGGVGEGPHGGISLTTGFMLEGHMVCPSVVEVS